MSSYVKVLGIHHLGIAPKDQDKARDFFVQIFNLSLAREEVVTDQKTHVMMFSSESESVREKTGSKTKLELLRGTEPDSPIAKFLAKKGSGIHHLALKVASLDDALSLLTEKKIKLVDTKPRVGAAGTRVIFIHPEATGGILIELVEDLRIKD
ncbi:MAG: methylmalonyl-CoA epimerase [Proteobacteria bacterium]|nr:methylmalonyl-CoA epimerase [Pseudomonadota bacterium]